MNRQKTENDKNSAAAFLINLRPHIALILANIMWGSSFLSTKLLLASLPPVTISICRFALASLFLFVYIKFNKKEAIHFDKNGMLELFLLGLFGITIYFYLENSSLLFITVVSASLIVALIPVITLLLSMIFLGEKLSFIN